MSGAQSSLVDTTYTLLKQDPRTLPVIATGAGVSHRWLRKFSASGGKNNTGANRIQKLYEFLSGKPLIKTN